jgi:hypothetical protein
MKLEPDAFRHHVDGMIAKGQKKQLEMWINHGLLIYVNHETLTEIWDEEYEEQFQTM